MNHKTHLWYTRRDGEVSGPFSTSVLRNKILLGRLTPNDEVSLDKSTWLPIAQHQELQPDSDHIQAKRTKLPQDERRGFDRRETTSNHEEMSNRRQDERRSPELDEEIARRQLRTFLMQRYRQRKGVLADTWHIFNVVCNGLIGHCSPNIIAIPKANLFSPCPTRCQLG